MRFLLNPVRRTARSTRRERKTRQQDDKDRLSRTVASRDTSYVKSWGQQCSPNCGCVVRFEGKLDPSTQTFVEANYHAKTVVAIPRNGKLEPVYTTRTHKPMLKECKCDTVHLLAQEISAFLPNKKIDQVRNMIEFTSTRSSPAFRHAVLAEKKLSPKDTHCFDVLEEAFTAMVKGEIPRQRKSNHMKTFEELLVSDLASYRAKEESRSKEEIGIDRSRLSMSSPKTMSALNMFDINSEHWDYDNHHNEAKREVSPASPLNTKTFDWVSYVDEMYENEESA